MNAPKKDILKDVDPDFARLMGGHVVLKDYTPSRQRELIEYARVEHKIDLVAALEFIKDERTKALTKKWDKMFPEK